MTVPKSRETNIYAATQGMRTCDNNSMPNPLRIYAVTQGMRACNNKGCETHVSNNEEMVFNYTEVLVYRSFTHPREVL